MAVRVDRGPKMIMEKVRVWWAAWAWNLLARNRGVGYNAVSGEKGSRYELELCGISRTQDRDPFPASWPEVAGRS